MTNATTRRQASLLAAAPPAAPPTFARSAVTKIIKKYNEPKQSQMMNG